MITAKTTRVMVRYLVDPRRLGVGRHIGGTTKLGTSWTTWLGRLWMEESAQGVHALTKHLHDR